MVRKAPDCAAPVRGALRGRTRQENAGEQALSAAAGGARGVPRGEPAKEEQKDPRVTPGEPHPPDEGAWTAQNLTPSIIKTKALSQPVKI